jgi:hypothetical protein
MLRIDRNIRRREKCLGGEVKNARSFFTVRLLFRLGEIEWRGLTTVFVRC